MEFREHLARCLQDPAFRAEWEAHEDCRAEESIRVRRISRLSRLRDGYKTQRDAERAEVRRLRAILTTYGAHDHDCERVTWPTAATSCTCGFDASLEVTSE